MDIRWGEVERRALRAARRSLGHSQSKCVDALVALGAAAVPQATFSKWETGQIRRPPNDALPALTQYLQSYSADPPDESGATNRSTSTDAEAQFDSVVRGITGEPLLGDLQRQLVEAIAFRLRNGPALSEEDERAHEWAARSLGMSQQVVTDGRRSRATTLGSHD